MPKDLTYLVFSEGLTFLRDKRLVEASNAFRRAVKEDSGNPRYLSYYGLIVALLEKDFHRAVSLCRAAIKHAPYEPELYVNLCKVYREAGQRSKALDALREGLSYDRENPLLLMEVRRMGTRRKPPLGFLARKNPLNKAIGKLTYKLRRTSPSSKGNKDSLSRKNSHS
jgi:tetratricopeptide (TPR) repeat protein